MSLRSSHGATLKPTSSAARCGGPCAIPCALVMWKNACGHEASWSLRRPSCAGANALHQSWTGGVDRSATRDADAAERCFRQVLQASHPLTPRVITVEKNAAAPPAFDVHQPDGPLPEPCLLRPCQ
jgi:hypothetical protein